MDDEGAVPDRGLGECRFAVLTPGHHCPTSVPLSVGRRRAFLDAAERHDLLLVEDDYDADLCMDRRTTPPPLKSTDTAGRVIYVGSLSKAIAPGLRIGFVVAPASILTELRALRRIALRHPPTNNQRTMANFVALGHYRTHVRHVAAVLTERAELAARLLPLHLPGCRVTRGAGAVSLWVELPGRMDAGEMGARLRAHGVLIEPGDVFFGNAGHGRSCFRLGLSSIRTDRIAAGLARLGDAIG